jgi:hypothetical protein
LAGKQPGNGKNGYYLASTGSVAWLDLYEAMAKALAKRGAIEDEKVLRADEEAVGRMAQALKCPPEAVAIQLGGL